MQNTPFVSVLMPVRNEGAFIARSLGAVVSQDYPRDRLEVIVSDGMSTDGTREVIADISRQHANVVLIDNLEKIAATGLNRALRVARGEIIVRVDGHCEIASDYVRACVLHLLDDQAECVGGPLETIGETFTAQAIATAMSSRFGVGGSTFRLGTNEARLTDTVAFPAYKRETIQRAGDFDEELVRDQDDEYNYRVRKLGGRVLLSPDIHSRYYSRAGLVSLWKQYFGYGYWKVRVLQKHPRQMRSRQFVPPLFVLALVLLLLTTPFLKGSLLLIAASLLGYAVTNLLAAIAAARKRKWRLLLLLPMAFTIIHLAYGLGFLFGLVRFCNRWEFSQSVKVVQASRDAASL